MMGGTRLSIRHEEKAQYSRVGGEADRASGQQEAGHSAESLKLYGGRKNRTRLAHEAGQQRLDVKNEGRYDVEKKK
jgi:hypothetical protein